MNRKTLILFLAVAALSSLLSSCNTFVGMSRDIQRLGQGIENTANGQQF